MREYVEMIIILYVDDKRKDLKLVDDHPMLVIFDSFKAQCTSSLLKLVDSHNINVTLIPPNCTDQLQPMDLSISKLAKNFFVHSFKSGMPKNCPLYYKHSLKVPVQIRQSI